jgi:hypothetical protein
MHWMNMRQLKLLAALVVTILILGCEEDPVTPPCTTCPCTDCYETQDALVQGLSSAYRTRNYDEFAKLFPTQEDNAPYYFFLNEPVNGISNWDLTEELRIHRRMFKPEDPLPGETPVPQELWLESISITLDRTAAEWTERTDLYRSDANPAGLDPAKWKATEAEYHADVLFNTVGNTDYRVDGRANFVVIEDLQRATGAAHKFLIYRWEDLGTFGVQIDVEDVLASSENALFDGRRPIAGSQTNWSGLKQLYQ